MLSCDHWLENHTFSDVSVYIINILKIILISSEIKFKFKTNTKESYILLTIKVDGLSSWKKISAYEPLAIFDFERVVLEYFSILNDTLSLLSTWTYEVYIYNKTSLKDQTTPIRRRAPLKTNFSRNRF